ncbi:hypothetical protein BABINDRAFT_159196 [Babjeviella inositovora NRRL Y-12698]|uniref:Uncharacterized protein n=1 Tax=Babjeviella inositovora NRRL Y-12698 TaxID=984486 RepID=A0A1E3QYC8_9ASCO|nr:uncharacterized protein BABINDRAFT_159196 [Babjeviella inositovora NRRL Y-12698]ODQ82663.1 hypothetical protein BABINDRAFT_159196 [Babjeviella inositovora NRRL Y-12698]
MVKYTSFKRGNSSIHAVSLDNAAKYILVGNDNVEISLMGLESQKIIQKYQGHASGVSCVNFNSENDQFVSGSKKLLIHDITTAAVLRSLQPCDDVHPSMITDAQFLTRELLVTCGHDSRVSIYDLRHKSKHNPTQYFDDPTDNLNALGFHYTSFVSAACNDGHLYTYDLRKGLVHDVDYGNGYALLDVEYPCLLSLPKTMRFGAPNETAVVVENATLKYIRPTDSLNLQCWDVTSASVKTLKVPKFQYRTPCKFIGGSEYIVCGSDVGELNVYETNPDEQVFYRMCTPPTKLKIVSAVPKAWMADVLSCLDYKSNTLVSGAGDGTLHVWKNPTPLSE